MATKVNINGKLVTRPGVYTLVKSGIQNAPVRLAYGKIAIVDDGIGAGWGGGKGKEAYTFDTIQDFRNFVKGGPLWDLAAPLFKPLPGKRTQGVSSITLIQARDTVAATISLDFLNGEVVLTTKDQGLNANGVIGSADLRQGYAAKFVAGATADRYILQIWHGTYKGLDTLNNVPLEGVTEANSAPVKLTESPEVASLTELKAWLDKDAVIQTGFGVSVTGLVSGGDLVTADLAANSGYVLATGATETYNASALLAAHNKAKEADVNFFLATKFGADARHQNNLDLVANVVTAGKYKRQVVIAGGATTAELDSVSIVAAEAYDSDDVIIAHGDGLTTVRSGFKKRSQLWKGAAILGRLAGLEPQTPLTLKQVGIDAETDTGKLDETQQERALSNGVLVTYYDDELGYEVILQGINSLQENDFLVNEDATSHSIQVTRITSQLNKELAIYLKRKYFGKETLGPNRNTITEEDLIAGTEGFLQSKVASSLQDNLIITFRNITATVSADVYNVNYEFVPNYEVSKIIVTGIILDK